jgi:hypothetical protein
MGRKLIGIHTPTGAAISSTLISPAIYKWIHAAYLRLAHIKNFLKDLLKLSSIYNAWSKSLNPQERQLKLANHLAIPHPLRQAMKRTFLATTKLVGSRLNYSMSGGITY